MADYGDEGCVRFCENVLSSFAQEVRKLYDDEDLERGYIISKNRNDITEKFPIVSISIAGVISDGKRYTNVDDFSQDLAFLKKNSKI